MNDSYTLEVLRKFDIIFRKILATGGDETDEQ